MRSKATSGRRHRRARRTTRRPPADRPVLLLVLAALAAGPAAAQDAVDFDRDIRPILTQHCYACHGPDDGARVTDLRLDRRESAFGDLGDGTVAVAPGEVSKSLLYRRVASADPYERMPPPDEGPALAREQTELVRRWIELGAPWSSHWAFDPPVRPPVPALESTWPRNAIDRFVLARLEAQGLEPSPRADRAHLLRRVTLDLTGLPPTAAELDSFAADTAAGAYERVVDRLLASPHYGERMATIWLDLARYADTNGYHADNHRSMWLWRDWVIEAFNANKPYDEFTIEQLAGDLLPDATTEQRIATGFNRNHPVNFEDGALEEEYLTKYVADRVNTTSTVWMGLTMACAECHDHKYDPLTQRDYYRMYAIFNNVPERGLDGERRNPVPSLRLASDADRKRLASFDERIERLTARLAGADERLDGAQAEWQEQAEAELGGPLAWQPLTPAAAAARNGSLTTITDAGAVRVDGPNPSNETLTVVSKAGKRRVTALRVEILPHPQTGSFGRGEEGDFVVSEIEAAWSADGRGWTDLPLLAADAKGAPPAPSFRVGHAIDGSAATGWSLGPGERGGRDELVLVLARAEQLPAGAIVRVAFHHDTKHRGRSLACVRLSTTDDDALAERYRPARAGSWWHVGPFAAASPQRALTGTLKPERGHGAGIDLERRYQEGRLRWTEHAEWTDGRGHRLPGEGLTVHYLYRELHADRERLVRLHLGSDDAMVVWLNAHRVHVNPARRDLVPGSDQVIARLQAGPNHLLVKVIGYEGRAGFSFSVEPYLPWRGVRLLRTPPSARGPDHARELRRFYRASVSTVGARLQAQLDELRRQREAFDVAIPETMVMAEMSEPRATHVLERGDYRRRGAAVGPGTPAVLPPPRTEGRLDRLALALWLVSPEHPLTARVAVNRLWQQAFGRGLVATPEDFGVRGRRPTHPALLDWLAVELREGGWDLKAMLKLIVTSATYRQSSRADEADHARDPDDDLLARAPRKRLTAEMVRDLALTVSGRLVRTIGGPSVRPYQPPGLWEAVGYGEGYSSQSYRQDRGPANYRRALYVYWKRSLPYPSMAVFDAPIRETCTARRPETVTPLQALVLLNDPVYVEASRGLARRMLVEGGGDVRARLAFGFRLCTSRRPSEREVSVLEGLLEEQLAHYRGSFGEAQRLVSVGNTPPPRGLDVPELAAWTTVANLMLNLDETLHGG